MSMHVYRVILLILFSHLALAAPATVTFQARIVKPDLTNLESSNVSFKFYYLYPKPVGADLQCVIYAEEITGVNMTGSKGLVTLQLGSGTRTYGSGNLKNVFDNSTPSYACQAGGTYTPSATDNRRIIVQFNDGTGVQTLPPSDLSAVPYAMQSYNTQRLGNNLATDFLKFTDFTGTCAAGEYLKYDSSSSPKFSCATPTGTGAGIVMSVAPGTGPLLVGGTAADPTISIPKASASVDGYLSSADFTTFNSKLSNLSSLTSGDITGKLGYTPAANNDSRFTDTRTPTDGSVTAAKIASATITFDKFNQSSATSGQVIKWNGSAWVASSDNTGGGGSVTNVSASGPLSSTGGGTPNITIAKANGTTDGYLSSTDWTTFSAKLSDFSSLVSSDITSKLGYTPVNPATAVTSVAGRTGAVTLSSGDISGLAFGTTAGTYAQGNDSRFTDTRTPTNDSVTSAKILDGTITSADLSNASIEASKLAQMGATSGQVMKWNGSAWVASSDDTGAGGTVTNVSASGPLSSTGGGTPNITIAKATSSVDGYLSSADFTTFSSKLSDFSSLVSSDITAKLGYTPVNPATLGTAALLNTNQVVLVSNMPSNCSAGQTLTFSSPTGSWVCSNIVLNSNSVTSAMVTSLDWTKVVNTPTTAAGYGIAKATSSVDGYLSSADWTIFSNKLANFSTMISSDVTTALGYTAANSSDVSVKVSKSGDTMTGALNLPTNGLAVGTDQLVVTGGNIGIGTATPFFGITYGASVRGIGMAGDGSDSSANFPALNLGNTRATPSNSDALGLINFISTNVGLNKIQAQIIGGNEGAGGSPNGFGGHLKFVTKANNGITSERMRIDSNGYVGIGTPSPSYALQVSGDISISGNFKVNGVNIPTGNSLAGVTQSATPFLTSLGTGASTTASGINNTFLGYNSGAAATTGTYNTATGFGALQNTAGAHYNTAMGANALLSNTTGSSNSAFGQAAMSGNVSGVGNTAMGYEALLNANNSENTALGYSSMRANTSGSRNTVLGSISMYSNTTGSDNVSIGRYSMYWSAAQSESTAIGVSAMEYAHSSGTPAISYNTAIGAYALRFSPGWQGAASGIKNTAIGHSALASMIQGSNNIGIGYGAGSSITSGSGNIVIGSNSGSTIATATNNILIADGAGNERIRVDSTGKVGLGTSNPNYALEVSGDISVSGNFKVNGVDINSGTIAPARMPALSGDVTMAAGTTSTTLANDAVTSTKILDATITSADLSSGSVTATKLESAMNGQLFIGDGTGFTKATLTGTTNQVTVTNGSGSITLSTPQNIATSSSPSFTGLTLSGITGNTLLRADASGVLANATSADITGLLGFTPATATWSLNVSGDVTRTTGNVGIGTASPTTPLSIVNNYGLVNFEAGQLVGSGPSSAYVPTMTFASTAPGGPSSWNGSTKFTYNADGFLLLHTGSSGPPSGPQGLGMSTGGRTTADLFINSTGYVGVGTANPSSSLSVQNLNSTASSVDLTQGLANSGMNIVTNRGSGTVFTPGLFWSTADNNSTKPKAGIWTQLDGTGSTIFLGTSNLYATGITNSAVAISPIGNVGIGTDSPNVSGWPDTTLTISGKTDAANGQGIIELVNNRTTPASSDKSGTLNFVSRNNAGAEKRTALIQSVLSGSGGVNGFGGTLYFNTKQDNAASTSIAMTINDLGNVGIGTSTPSRLVTFKGKDSTPWLAVQRSGSVSEQLTITNNETGSLTASTGTTVPTWTNIVDSANSNLMLSSNFSGGSGGKIILDSPNVGIGTTNPSYTLHVNGSVAGTSAYNNLSDARLKKNVTNVSEALNKIDQIRGVTFDWDHTVHPELKLGDRQELGVIAQEVEKVFPQAVSQDSQTGIKSVAYSMLIAPLIEAVKELFAVSKDQSREIASIKSENEKLKKENEDVKKRLERIEKLLNQKEQSDVSK